jgi:hypothetical protein
VSRSRKSRKRRRPAGAPRSAGAGPSPAAPANGDAYARARAKDDAARAALKPLRPGERPLAVTIGAIVAAVLALANVIAMIAGYNPGEDTLSPGSRLTGGILVALVLGYVAYGMWRARYGAVLGMQTLLALTIVFSALSLMQAVNWWAFILVSLILIASGTLFWFLIKAMARIQMPERPGSS